VRGQGALLCDLGAYSPTLHTLASRGATVNPSVRVRRRRLRRPSKSEAYKLIELVWGKVQGVAAGGAHIVRSAPEAATPHYPLSPSPLIFTSISGNIGIGPVHCAGPLQDVPGHLLYSVEGGSCRVLSYGCWSVVLTLKRIAACVVEFLSPRVDVACPDLRVPPGGFLLFSLAGQMPGLVGQFCQPRSILVRLMPAHTDHWAV
jgi:hypothetical protein